MQRDREAGAPERCHLPQSTSTKFFSGAGQYQSLAKSWPNHSNHIDFIRYRSELAAQEHIDKGRFQGRMARGNNQAKQKRQNHTSLEPTSRRDGIFALSRCTR
jgi:hypothetical protein